MTGLLLARVSALFVLLNVLSGQQAVAQCSAWTASATVLSRASCAGNGAFSVQLSGPDAGNLSNIQYGIPGMPGTFTVPLNSSPVFSNLPPGTFTVSVVADCGGGTVGRSTSVTVPGAYQPPTLNPAQSTIYGSLNCGANGALSLVGTGGIGPFIFNITSCPASYTGRRSDTSRLASTSFINLPPGSYTVQLSDSCRNATVPRTFLVPSLDPRTAPLSRPNAWMLGCDSLVIQSPRIDPPSATHPWNGWQSFQSVLVSYQIPGVVGPTVPRPQRFSTLTYNLDTVRLPAGMTARSVYGRSMRVVIRFDCGDSIVNTYPNIVQGASYPVFERHCDSSLRITLSQGGNLCLPLSYTVRNQRTNLVYGPYTVGTTPVVLQNLPLGSYVAGYVSADGYRDSTVYNVPSTPATPYGISVLPGTPGINGYIQGFRFTDASGGVGGYSRQVELFSGPAGYSFSGTWGGTSVFEALANHSPTALTLKFPVGSYIWKITDDCGTYYLPITVTAADLWQFTTAPPVVLQTCNGITVYPSGTVANQGNSYPVHFMVFRNGFLYTVPGGGSRTFPAGTPINLTEPGTYDFVTTGSVTPYSLPGLYNPGGIRIGLPNSYLASSRYVYTREPVSVDLTGSQAFACPGGGPGAARIDVRGAGGFPFAGSLLPSYRYFLAQQGNGLSGPYLDSNFSGVFTGFGGSAYARYDLKVVDSCGAFAVQELRVLDLGLARLATASSYVACAGDSIVLNAGYLPGASYSWAGPNGFRSTLRSPVVRNVAAAGAGQYVVAITTTACQGVLLDTIRLAVNPAPAKPVLSHTCSPRPVTLVVTNPANGVGYTWEWLQYNTTFNRFGPPVVLGANLPRTRYVDRIGSWKAIATDSVYGCSIRSDSLVFLSQPLDEFKASIYTPHQQICSGDSTILAARWTGAGLQPAFQWLRNGSPVAGARGISYTARIAGTYRVIIDAGVCNYDTSSAVMVTVVPRPSDTISASPTVICTGESALLSAASGVGYGYSWELNGSRIPGAFGSTYAATQPGGYAVLTTNGACFVRSKTIIITQQPGIDRRISPQGSIAVCDFARDTIPEMMVHDDAGWRYAWYRNGMLLAGDSGSRYTPRREGSYHVVISSQFCDPVSSDTVAYRKLPGEVRLGNDTVVCEESRFPLLLSADSGFVSYRWSSGDTTRSIMVPGTGLYSVTATNRCGSFRDTVRIGNGDDFLPKFPDDTLVCTSTQRLVLRLPPGLASIRWNTGERGSSIYVDTPGLYFMRAYGPCGLVTDTVAVSFCRPAIRLVEGPGPICDDQCISVRAAVDGYPDSYSWSFEGGTPALASGAGPFRVCYGTPGEYRVVLVVSNKGGSDTGIYYVSVQPRPQLRFRDTTVLATYNIPMRLPACADARIADWYENGRLICEGCQELSLKPKHYQSTYRCVVRNGDCPDSCSYSLRVLDIPNNVWLPTGFTPNGDGLNDRFGIITDNPNIEVGNLSVYNRWGQRVFVSNRNDDGWDGTFGGRPAEAGVYFWQLSYRILGSDTPMLEKGDVTLIR